MAQWRIGLGLVAVGMLLAWGWFAWRDHAERDETSPSLPVRARKLPLSAVTRVPSFSVSGAPKSGASGDIFQRFNDWLGRYLGATPASRSALEKEGLALAMERREALKRLIRQDPRGALEQAIDYSARQQLSSSLVQLLETTVSGYGAYRVLAIDYVNGPPPEVALEEPDPYTRRTVEMHGFAYRAYVYGRRVGMTTKSRVPLNGIAVDQLLALNESPLRVLSAAEIAARAPNAAVEPSNCPLCNRPASPQMAADLGGKVLFFDRPEHIPALADQWVAAESAIGPTALPDGEGPLPWGQTNVVGLAGYVTTNWTFGGKRVLLMRVDFSDFPGVPADNLTSTSLTSVVALDLVTNLCDRFYREVSYGKTWLTNAVVTTGVLRMPKTGAYYATNDASDELLLDARAAAATAGYDTNACDLDIVAFRWLGGSAVPGSWWTWAGLGYVGDKGLWLNGYFNRHVTTHELGHNYGLRHASFWSSSTVLGTGTNIEYGNIFDCMGSAPSSVLGHFSPWFKRRLGWLNSNHVQSVTGSGTFRVWAHDHPLSVPLTNTFRGLVIPLAGGTNCWVEFRRHEYPTDRWLTNGVVISLGYDFEGRSHLLDMTPSSRGGGPAEDAKDAPLALNVAFTNAGVAINCRPVATGLVGSNYYMDVQVSFGNRLAFGALDYHVDEQAGMVSVNLVRSGDGTGVVSVNYATEDGSAVAGTNYGSTNGSMIWGDGDLAPKTIVIPILTNASAEAVESFVLRLSGMSGGIVFGPAAVTISIHDPGSVDPSFSHDFINSTVQGLLVQPDGKVLIGGFFGTVGSRTREGFARLDAGGALDAAFGAGSGVGDAIFQPVRALALQADGKVLIGGSFTNVHGVARNRIARLNTDGSLDAGFNPIGGADNDVRSIAVQPDGKVLVGGNFTQMNGVGRTAVARLNADGTLDPAFTSPLPQAGNDSVYAMALQPDGKVLVGGWFYFTGFSPAWHASIARLNTNGAVDAVFGTNLNYGAHASGLPSTLQHVLSLAVQGDGQILVGGTFTAFNNLTHTRLVRLRTNGVLDASFNPSIDPGVASEWSSYLSAVMVQPNGKIVIGGAFSQVNGTACTNLARLNADGSLDTSFYVGAGSPGEVNAIAAQPDGMILIGTDYGSIQGGANTHVARLFGGLNALPGIVEFGAAAFSGNEGDSATVTVNRTGGSDGIISINYATVAGTALAATDFTARAGTLVWSNGDAASKTISIPVLNDGVSDDGEIFTLRLGIPIGGTMVGAVGDTTVAIHELSDGLPPYLSITSPSDLTFVTNGSVTVVGSAVDISGVSNVLANAVGATTANAFTNWSAVVGGLAGGTNAITVIAKDLAAPPNFSTGLVRVIYADNTFSSGNDRRTLTNIVGGVTNVVTVTVPDSWKIRYFGTNFLNDPRADGSADPLGLGMPNWMKFLAGLNPLDRTDRFEVPSHHMDQGTGNATYTLQWRSKVGKVYQVQYSTDLKAWSNVSPTLTATGTTTSWVDDGSQTGFPPSAQTKRFYRVKVVP